MLENIIIDLDYRMIEKDENSIDIFVDCDEKVFEIEDDTSIFFNSRIQFPKVRMILLRVSKISNAATVHILKDIDLFSAYANFEIRLKDEKLYILKDDNVIKMKKNN